MDAMTGVAGTAELDRIWRRLWPRFARVEARGHGRGYLTGLLGRVERKNSWQLAEGVGEPTPHGMQELLNRAVWDADAVRDDLRAYVVEQLGDPAAVLIVDETGVLKKGAKPVGVQRQYSGTAGRIENCQIGVFLAYAAPAGAAFLDRELYLPRVWVDDVARREEAGVPVAVEFRTKPELARAMLARTLGADVPFGWVTGDEVYGGDRRLRVWLEEQGAAHLLAIKATEPLWALTDRGPAQVTARELVAALPAAAWARLSAGDGAKGPRIYDWAWRPIRPLREPERGHWLLARRSLADPAELAYYVGFGPAATPLAELVRVAGTRWAIEGGFEATKAEVGLDHDQVRRWEGWHRHITLCLLAHAVLTATRAGAEKGGPVTIG